MLVMKRIPRDDYDNDDDDDVNSKPDKLRIAELN